MWLNPQFLPTGENFNPSGTRLSSSEKTRRFPVPSQERLIVLIQKLPPEPA